MNHDEVRKGVIQAEEAKKAYGCLTAEVLLVSSFIAYWRGSWWWLLGILIIFAVVIGIGSSF